MAAATSSAAAAEATATTRQEQQPHRIVICGGGVIGTCTAYFLSKKAPNSTKIILVEKSSVACAASGKAAGSIALYWCDGGPLSSLARASFDLHRSLSQLLDGPNNYGYRHLNTLSLSILNPNPSKSTNNNLPSWIDGPTGPPKTIGTLETTAQVHPRLFAQTLIKNAAGVDVVIGKAESVRVENGRVTGVMLGDGNLILADAVVLALGPWSARLPLVSSLFAVSGLKYHSIVLRPADTESITPHALLLSYQVSASASPMEPNIYPRPTGEVYICGMPREAEVPDDPEEIVGDPESIEMLYEIAGTVSSHLRKGGGAETVAEQACILPCTDDGLPVIGEMPGVGGCFVGTGHGGWGILNGPATGASLAELILEGKSNTVDLAPFAPARFLLRRDRK